MTMNHAHPDALAADPTLWRILERCAEDTIDEERVQRVLEPVLAMIREGRFSRRRRAVRAALPIAAVAAAAFVTVGIGRYSAGREALVEISPEPVPLGSATEAQPLSGRVLWEGTGLGGAGLTLLAADGEIAGTAVTDEDGRYRFTGVAEGSYRLRAALPPGLWQADGETALTVTNDPDARKDIEVWVYGSRS